jgi:hypothetical protein
VLRMSWPVPFPAPLQLGDRLDRCGVSFREIYFSALSRGLLEK